MLGTTPISDNPGRLTALQTALQAFMPERVFKTGYRRDFSDHSAAELAAGVLQLVVADEDDFSDQPGKVATEGSLSVAVVLQLRVAESDDGSMLQTAELAAGEQLKSFVRAGVAGLGLTLESLATSAQQETPYGYVVAHIIAGPPRTNLN